MIQKKSQRTPTRSLCPRTLRTLCRFCVRGWSAHAHSNRRDCGRTRFTVGRIRANVGTTRANVGTTRANSGAIRADCRDNTGELMRKLDECWYHMRECRCQTGRLQARSGTRSPFSGRRKAVIHALCRAPTAPRLHSRGLLRRSTAQWRRMGELVASSGRLKPEMAGL
jgi:hypothetical protein